MIEQIKSFLKPILKKTPLWRIREYQNVRRYEKMFLKRKSYFLIEGEELLGMFAKILNDNGILFWLDFGTLLGYYREHDFIKYDFDLDFGIFLNDSQKVRQLLTSNGFELIREFYSIKDGGKEECYLYKHTSIDVFYYREDEEKNTIYCNSFSCDTDKFSGLNRKSQAKVKRIDLPRIGLKQVEYKNCIVNIPINPEIYLQKHYGKSFMIPNPDFDYKKEATNITYYKYEEMPGEYIIHKII